MENLANEKDKKRFRNIIENPLAAKNDQMLKNFLSALEQPL